MKVLMVCLGNICRSPLAEGILQSKIADRDLHWSVDSAGTAGYHDGELPDERSIQVAHKHGIDITSQRSRKLIKEDFENFDLILAMDASNYNNIEKIRPEGNTTPVKMILNYSYPKENRQVPDPYYGGGFDAVYEMLVDACDALIDQELPH